MSINTKRNFLFTSESVTEGHPDKICDQVSDAILDDALKQDSDSRVAIECLTKSSSIMIGGEMTTNGFVDVQQIARGVLKDIGYTNPEFGIDYKYASIWSLINAQSPDISQGVIQTADHEQGAGDQGIMFGYACNETPQLMPLPIMLAHSLTKKLADVRKAEIIKDIGPDGKSQVTVEYKQGEPRRVQAVVIAQQHLDSVDDSLLRQQIRREVIEPVVGKYLDDNSKIYINTTGRFVIGGPEGDAGVTGRKIIVDTYGGMGKHGGGAFSGKDPSKVDRSGAYAARHIAKNVVASGLAERCEVQIGYAIGVAEPTGVYVDTFGTGKRADEYIAAAIESVFDLRPRAIIEILNLKRPIYRCTAAYGHFGREEEGFTWELTDRVDDLKTATGM